MLAVASAEGTTFRLVSILSWTVLIGVALGLLWTPDLLGTYLRLRLTQLRKDRTPAPQGP